MTVVPRLSLPDSRAGLRVLPLSPDCRRTLLAVMKADQTPLPATEAFLRTAARQSAQRARQPCTAFFQNAATARTKEIRRPQFKTIAGQASWGVIEPSPSGVTFMPPENVSGRNLIVPDQGLHRVDTSEPFGIPVMRVRFIPSCRPSPVIPYPAIFCPSAMRPLRSSSRPGRRPRSGHSPTSRWWPGLVGGRRSGGAPDVKCAALLGHYEASVASKPTSMFINLETGQAAFACIAIDWNVALSMPGILAMTVRRTGVMENPSPSLSMTTSDLLSNYSGINFAIPSNLTNDMVKHAACAAPSGSSGLVPGFSP